MTNLNNLNKDQLIDIIKEQQATIEKLTTKKVKKVAAKKVAKDFTNERNEVKKFQAAAQNIADNFNGQESINSINKIEINIENKVAGKLAKLTEIGGLQSMNGGRSWQSFNRTFIDVFGLALSLVKDLNKEELFEIANILMIGVSRNKNNIVSQIASEVRTRANTR